MNRKMNKSGKLKGKILRGIWRMSSAMNRKRNNVE